MTVEELFEEDERVNRVKPVREFTDKSEYLKAMEKLYGRGKGTVETDS